MEIDRFIFQNEACLVINKMTGESSEKDELVVTGGPEPKTEKVFPVHRLDTPVSGCFLLARNQEAAAFLGSAFSRQAAGLKENAGPDSEYQACVKKRYWAIIEKPRDKSGAEIVVPAEGELSTSPPEGRGQGEVSRVLVHWIVEDKKLNKSFASTSASKWRDRSPKKAVLRYRLAGQGDNYLFLDIDLITGRHHQIRAQLAAEGFHIKGDLKYGAKRSEKGGGIRLHAYSLAFPNPLNPGEIVKVEALPPIMDTLWKAFQSSLSNLKQ